MLPPSGWTTRKWLPGLSSSPASSWFRWAASCCCRNGSMICRPCSSPSILSLCPLKGYDLVLLGKVEAGRRLLEQACTQLAGISEAGTEYAQALIFRSIAYRFLGEYRQVEQDTDIALSLLASDFIDEEDHRDLIALAQKSKGLALCSMGSLEIGIEWLQCAL